MELEFINKLVNNLKQSEFVQDFINELSNFLENNKNSITKYSKYWKYQNFMEDNVASNIGISRWSADVRYREEISKAVDDNILALSESEGALYRKKFKPKGPSDNKTYNVDKFENGRIEHLTLGENKIPKGFDNQDIIFQYKDDGSVKVRMDLKKQAVKLASKNAEFLKMKENEMSSDYKREGHIYKAVENDGYVFLKDLTEKRDYVFEDIDFVVNCYEGEGKYQVVNGKYKKIGK